VPDPREDLGPIALDPHPAAAPIPAQAAAKLRVQPFTAARHSRGETLDAGGEGGPAYSDWADQMYRKAPLRRLCKRLPLGDDFFLAAKADELADAGEPDKIAPYIDVDSTESTESRAVQDSLAAKVAESAARARSD
jgi:hypothetical protein